jgi:hypothetical protein
MFFQAASIEVSPPRIPVRAVFGRNGLQDLPGVHPISA